MESEQSRCTDYVDISAAYKLIVSGSTGNNGCVLVVYDAGQTMIEVVLAHGTWIDEEIVVDESWKYCRASSRLSGVKNLTVFT